jgi:septal ring factor EnvC (AmiA/AmiB activator)
MKARAIGGLGIGGLAIALLPAAADPPIGADASQRLLAALVQAPTVAILVQPGSVDDLIHLRAALAGLGQQLAARTADRGSGAAAYRLPVAGRLVTGFGTVSEAGVRSRGLTFAVPPGAAVVAPAGGVVRYAQAFRGYGGTVIVDHGRGWTSVLTGLGTLGVRTGARVGGGTAIGTARRTGQPHVTVELRRRGEPVDAMALIR